MKADSIGYCALDNNDDKTTLPCVGDPVEIVLTARESRQYYITVEITHIEPKCTETRRAGSISWVTIPVDEGLVIEEEREIQAELDRLFMEVI